MDVVVYMPVTIITCITLIHVIILTMFCSILLDRDTIPWAVTQTVNNRIH